MKIIGFVSSPKKEGNTETLVKQILLGASNKGADVQLINLNDLNIKYCQGCNYCKSNETCIIQDDMQTLYKKIDEADTFIIGSPIYFWQINAQAKTFIDRLYACFDKDLNLKFDKNKNVVLAYTQGNPEKKPFERYYKNNRQVISFLKFNLIDQIVATGTCQKHVKNQPKIMEKAKKLGESLAK